MLAAIVFAVLYVLVIANDAGDSAEATGERRTTGRRSTTPARSSRTCSTRRPSPGWLFIVASGFSLIFGLMRVVNMAHGAFYLLGGYIAYEIQQRMTGGHARLHPGLRSSTPGSG